MPLHKDASDKSREYNIEELIHAGHDPSQAAAIGYRIQREAGGHPPAAPHKKVQRKRLKH